MMTMQKATSITIVVLLTLCIWNGSVFAETASSVPEVLQVPSNQIPAIKTHAIGVQIYECTEDKNDPSRHIWVFKAPKAELYDNTDKQIGRHYAGPTWEADDGSKVVGEIVAAYNSPDKNSIPWLLLKAKSNYGSGAFSRIVSIQRLDTVGGKAPDEGCGKEQTGKEIQVPYKALYYFYKVNP